MTDRAYLTGRYLAEITGHHVKAGELLGPLPRSDLLTALYQQRFLSRPVFLGAGELAQLHQDLEQLRAALVSLPDRRYDGDLAAFARAAGLTEVQVSAILRASSAPVTRLTRADLYADKDGFHALELNFGSAVGGIDNAELCRGLLEHPLLAGFARANGLGYVDTMAAEVATILDESPARQGSCPVVALANWQPDRPVSGPYLTRLCAYWRELGLDAHACHIGELTVAGGRVQLRRRPVDIIFRLFLLEDLLEPDGPALIGPLLDAAARGQVTIFTPLDSELYGSKSAIAMLSDECSRQLLSPAELASLDRVLPWTRMVAPGQVTLADGQRVDLIDYAVAHQDELVLKPALMSGGKGVVLGSAPGCGPAQWREHLTAALSQPHVIQRRIEPEPELFPGSDGELVPWIVTWGMFTVATGFGGIYTRAVPAAGQVGAINRHSGAHVGSGLAVTSS